MEDGIVTSFPSFLLCIFALAASLTMPEPDMTFGEFSAEL